MATGPDSAGIDVLGIVAPMVDLGFTLAGNFKVTAIFTIGGKQSVSGQTDQATTTGATTLTVKAIAFKRRDDEGTDVSAKDQNLLVNVADLEAAAKALNLSALPTIRTNDTVVISGQKWTIFAIESPPNLPVMELRIRR